MSTRDDNENKMNQAQIQIEMENESSEEEEEEEFELEFKDVDNIKKVFEKLINFFYELNSLKKFIQIAFG